MRLTIYGLFAGVLLAQTASFDAASIKPSSPDSTGTHSDVDGGFMRIGNFTLKKCIARAYGIGEERVLGGPKWLDETRYDIVAKINHTPAQGEMNASFQALLRDRFALTVHHEMQPRPGFALTVSKGGIKAALASPDDIKHRSIVSGPPDSHSIRTMDVKGMSMELFAPKLQGMLGMPVVDETALKDYYNFSLTWSTEEVQSDPESVWLPGMLQSQIGIRLEPRKIPTDMLVIDHAELPSEN